LESLDLSRNKLNRIPNLRGLKNLEHLELSYNQITDIKKIWDFPNLTYFGCNHNKISKIDDLNCLTHIKVISMEGNSINLAELKTRFSEITES
jgi:Leucine-rich repeat (LRR) protein